MDTTILQVPVKKSLRDQAALAAQDLGFSSLQETVRVFLAKLANGKVDIGFREPTVLSPKAAARYDKMVADIESGKAKTKTFTSVDSLMDDLMK